EKLQAQEKKKPGTVARIFSTHPMVGDRIDKVNSLIARFPDRSEYTINTSEFQQVKNRLISLTNARAVGGRGGGATEADSKRPTLKRRQPSSGDSGDSSAGGSTTGSGDQEQKTERPTLRKNGDTKPPGNE